MGIEKFIEDASSMLTLTQFDHEQPWLEILQGVEYSESFNLFFLPSAMAPERYHQDLMIIFSINQANIFADGREDIAWSYGVHWVFASTAEPTLITIRLYEFALRIL